MPGSCRSTHVEHRPERRPFFAKDLHAEIVQFPASGSARLREEQHVERLVVRQRLLLDGQGQQRRLEFVVRLVGQDGLRLRIRPQLLRDGLGRADQISMIGNVGHDARSGGLQARAESLVQRRAGLDDISTGIALGAQMLGNREGHRLGGVEQSVFEQESRRAAEQLAKGRGSVAETKGERDA